MAGRLFVIYFMVFVIGCTETSEKREGKVNDREINAGLIANPVTLNSKDEKVPLPQMSFDSEEHDFGQVNEGDTLNYVFTFKNSGDAPLVISSAESSCGCTIPYYPKKPVFPGESDEVKIEFNTKGKTGMHVKEVVFYTNTQPSKQIIKIKADIIPEELVNKNN